MRTLLLSSCARLAQILPALLMLAMATRMAAPAAQAQQPGSLTNGLVAFYPFDGDARDASGNGNHVNAAHGKAQSNGLGTGQWAAIQKPPTFWQAPTMNLNLPSR